MGSRDNADYWVARHDKHRNQLVAVGDIRRTEAENLQLYAVKKRRIVEMLRGIGLLDLEGRAVIDVGCGIGSLSELFYALGAKVYGVDASPVAVESASNRCPDGEFQVGSVVDFKFDAQCDLAISADVLYHVVDDDNWRAALANMVSHVKPGGWIVVVDQLRGDIYSPAPHVRYRTRALYREAFAGLNAEEFQLPGNESNWIARVRG